MMKKIYLLLPLAMLTTLAMGQINYTFQVDMNGETVSSNGLHVAGNFQGEANGDDLDWQPAANEMTDADMDGIYSVTVSIPAGGYEYKFINDNNWGSGEEGIPEVSQVGFGNGNRYFQLTADSDSTNGPVVFGGSAPDGMVAMKLQVGLLSGPDDEGAHVAGNFSDPIWTPSATALYNISGNIYAVTYSVYEDSSYTYKFLTGNDWGSDESGIPDSCQTGGNRTITIAGDTIVGDVCFNSCGPCQASYITFKVDMNLACIDLSTEVVNLMGTVSNWGDGEPMQDDDADGIWEVELPIQSGDWVYKFRVGGGNWEGFPGDRMLTVETGVDSVLAPYCWGSGDVCSSEAFAPSEVTFTVNLSDSTLEAGTNVYVMGDFTSPSWQDGSILMTDNSDGTYSTTVSDFCPQEGRYKFAFGASPNDSIYWVEENAEFQQEGGCGEDNGDFPDNRVFVRASADPIELCFVFNTCDDCAVGVEEIESLNRVEIYPNPATDLINIVFDKNAEYSVRIMDISGKVIYTNSVNAERLVISENSMVSGIYFVQIIDADNNSITKKLIVK